MCLPCSVSETVCSHGREIEGDIYDIVQFHSTWYFKILLKKKQCVFLHVIMDIMFFFQYIKDLVSSVIEKRNIEEVQGQAIYILSSPGEWRQAGHFGMTYQDLWGFSGKASGALKS